MPAGGGPKENGCEVWGVLNVTPDSFSDGGRFLALGPAIEHARRMLAEGADVLDVGGESSRPAGRTYGDGAAAVSTEEELGRVIPVVTHLVNELRARVSVDTVKPEVARVALGAGAHVINDVSCGGDRRLLEIVADHGAEVVLMHNRARGEVSVANTAYRDVVADVIEELNAAADRAQSAGVEPHRIWIDPGIGFAKTAAQSIELIARTADLCSTGYRVLVGPSRKSFIAQLAPDHGGQAPRPDERAGGTAASLTCAVLGGAQAVRVHDVRSMRQAVVVAQAAASVGAGP